MSADRLYTACRESKVLIVDDLATGQQIAKTNLPGNPWRVSLRHDNSQLAVACAASGTVIMDAGTLATIHIVPGESRAVAFSHSGDVLAVGNEHVRLVESETWKERDQQPVGKGIIFMFAFSPRDDRLLSCHNNNVALIWSVAPFERRHVLSGHSDTVRAGEWIGSEDSDYLRVVTGSDDRKLRIWDAQSGDCLKVIEDGTKFIIGVAISHDNLYMASACMDNTCRVYAIEKSFTLVHATPVPHQAKAAAFIPDSLEVVCAVDQNASVAISVSTGAILRTYSKHENAVLGLAVTHAACKLMLCQSMQPLTNLRSREP